ncbi:MAG TPA: thioesterase family protein [Rhizomicrobium sp.]|nr:thioesterase family protein [Rhizomicrobium sp.]
MSHAAAESFSATLNRLVPRDGAFLSEPQGDWTQGRTLFGGLLAALAAAAARDAFPDLPPLRSAQLAYLAPATPELSLRPALLRAGKSSSFVRVDMQAAGELALTATLMFGSARRSSHLYRGLAFPDVAPPGQLPDYFDPLFAPGFSRQFDARLAAGARPVSGDANPEVLLWLRHRDSAAPDDIRSILALADVPPPGAMAMFAKPAPVSTMTWAADILTDCFHGNGWHLMQVQTESVGDGYSSQRMTLWSSAGEPAVAARQTAAIYT